jgi:hypothetical protein
VHECHDQQVCSKQTHLSLQERFCINQLENELVEEIIQLLKRQVDVVAPRKTCEEPGDTDYTYSDAGSYSSSDVVINDDPGELSTQTLQI